jgi:hypothetical protein
VARGKERSCGFYWFVWTIDWVQSMSMNHIDWGIAETEKGKDKERGQVVMMWAFTKTVLGAQCWKWEDRVEDTCGLPQVNSCSLLRRRWGRQRKGLYTEGRLQKTHHCSLPSEAPWLCRMSSSLLRITSINTSFYPVSMHIEQVVSTGNSVLNQFHLTPCLPCGMAPSPSHIRGHKRGQHHFHCSLGWWSGPKLV